jgi:hypothetical protein
VHACAEEGVTDEIRGSVKRRMAGSDGINGSERVAWAEAVVRLINQEVVVTVGRLVLHRVD